MAAHNANTGAGFWVLCACGSLTMLSARSGEAAEWSVNPTARVSTDYSTNPRLRVDGDAESIAAVGDLSATLVRRSDRTLWSLTPRLYSERHPDDKLLDRDDEHLRGAFTYYSERSQWAATVNFAHDTTLTSELGLTGYTEDNRQHEGISATLGPTYQLSERTSAGFQMFWNDNHYRDALFTGLVDYQYGALSLFSGHSLSDRSELSVSARAGELHVPVNPGADKQDASLTLGWRYKPWPLWTLNLSAGPSYAKSNVASDDGLVFQTDLQHQGERWTFTTSAGRDITPTGRGALTRRDQFSVAASHSLTERLSASLTLRAVRNQELLTQSGRRGEALEYGRVDVRLTWRMAQQWSLALGLGSVTQKVESRPERADNYGASLSIVWNGQPQFL
jgi:hypothetical protein